MGRREFKSLRMKGLPLTVTLVSITRSHKKQQPIARNARNIYVSRVEMYMEN